MNNFNPEGLSPQKVDQLLKMASQKLGTDPQTLRSQLQSGNLQQVLGSLQPGQAQQISQLLQNPQAMQQLLQNPQLQALIQQFSGGR